MEPEQLKRGKEFHKLVQGNWQHDAKGGVNIEHTINLFPPSSNFKHMKKGRLDIMKYFRIHGKCVTLLKASLKIYLKILKMS